MQSFKKALFVSLAFVLCVIIISALLVEPLFINRPNYFQDSEARNELSGTIDFAISGSSYSYRAFDPNIIDGVLGTSGYNFSGARMTMAGRYEMLKLETERNPIKTVVFDMSCDTLYRNRDEEGPEGDLYLLSRIDSPLERLKYASQQIRLDEYFSVYYYFLKSGISAIINPDESGWTDSDRVECRGYYPRWMNDMSMTAAEYAEIRNTESMETEIYAENLEYLNKIIELCKEKDIRLIFVTVPVSNQTLCRVDNLDVPREKYAEIAEANGIEFYDLNLLKNRSELFPEETAFFDDSHLSTYGSATFSSVFAELMQTVNGGGDVTDMFFSSYKELDANSVYSK